VDASLVNTAVCLSFIACVCGVISLLRRAGGWDRLSATSSTGGVAALSLGLALRWMEAGHPPMASLYETLLVFAWASWLVVLLLAMPRRMRELAALAPFVSLLCLCYASTMDPSIRPLVPALRSNWLAIHVAANILGYAGFAAAFVAGLGLAAALRRRSGGRGPWCSASDSGSSS